MRRIRLALVTAITAAFLGASLPDASAQGTIDLSGHWEGTITMPGNATFEIDFVRDASGQTGGTVTVPAENLRGLPLQKVTIDGASVRFYARTDQQFAGSIAADAKSISGSLEVEGFSVPFALTRRGDARVSALPKGGPLAKTLEGTWNGTIQSPTGSLRLVLTLANQPDGTSTSHIVNLDEGGLRIPVAVTQQAAAIVVDASAVGGSFSGVVNAAGTEIVGTYREGTGTVPLTFRRAGQ